MKHNTKQSGNPLKLELKSKLIDKIDQALKERGAEIEVDLAGCDEPATMKEQVKILKKIKRDGVIKKYKITSQSIELDAEVTESSNLEKEMNPECEFEYEQALETCDNLNKTHEHWALNVKKADINKSKFNRLVNINAQEKATKGKGNAIKSKPEPKSKFIYNDQTGDGALRGKRFRMTDGTAERKLLDVAYSKRGQKIPCEDVITTLDLDPDGANNEETLASGRSNHKALQKCAKERGITIKVSNISSKIRSKTGLTTKEFVNNRTNITLNI